MSTHLEKIILDWFSRIISYSFFPSYFSPAPVSATEVIDAVIKNNPLKHYQRPVKHVDDLITVRVSFFVQGVREFVSFNITSQCHNHFPSLNKTKLINFKISVRKTSKSFNQRICRNGNLFSFLI